MKTSRQGKDEEVVMTSGGKCPKRALKIFGDFQTLSIVEALGQGELRYCALQRALGDMNPVTLTKRLKMLEGEGIIGRRTEAMDKLSVSYYLEEKGKRMLPILRNMRDFAMQYL